MFDTAKFLGSVKLHSKQTVSLNSERSLLLLAYLASANEACSRESLIDFLWEDDKRDSFRVMLSRLRKQLPDWLVSTRDTIQLAPLVSHDLHAFEKLKKGKLKEKLEALWLIRGEFLSGVYGPTLGAQQWRHSKKA